MRSADRLSIVTQKNPLWSSEDIPHHEALMRAHDDLKIYPPYPRYLNRSREFEVEFFDDTMEIGIDASLRGKLAQIYRRLDGKGQDGLANKIEQGMGRAARQMMGADWASKCPDEPLAMVGVVPVVFEPMHNAMLVGEWVDGWKHQEMHIQSRFIETRQEQRLLLGGYAALVTYLENNKHLLIP